MTPPDQKLRLSFQTKVLLPVLAALVLLPSITLWIINRYISDQMEREAQHSLETADTVFRQTLEFQARSLRARFLSAAKENIYRSLAGIAGSNDQLARASVRSALTKQLKVYGDDYDALLLATGDNPPHVVTGPNANGDLEGWAKITAPLTLSALQGDAAQGTLEFHGRFYVIVSVPAYDTQNILAGALTVAARISEDVLQEVRKQSGAEILLIADNDITASSLSPADRLLFRPLLGRLNPASGTGSFKVEVHQDHYLALNNTYEGKTPLHGFHYILLSSYEGRLREFQRTQLNLLMVSVAGIGLSGVAVWSLIRRITRPLVELRNNAEAVGHGDFTRRITRFSNDECGAVAVAFNDMTGNLQASRAELEKAVGSLKKTQAQLIQSEKLSAVGQFVAGIAHELNNPLTVVIGFSDLLLSTEMDPKHKDHLERISKSATRCHKIVNSLLGFSRQHEPERKPVRLNALVDAVVEIVAYDLRTSNIALVKEYQPDLPPISGDFHQLQQVVLNIISNARQATEAFRRDGQIVLRTGRTDTHVWLRIKDNGPGMSREILNRIFDPFFTTKPQGKGTGLGLSLSYGIMQEHKGRIHAESEPGVGTEFILELPIADPAGASPPRPDSTPPLKTKTRSLHVLVVDDEESILHLIREILHSDGCQVTTASSGQDAFELIRQNRYDVIISDWKMPGLNGINLYQQLLVQDPAAAKKMLFMTGDVIKESFQDFLRQHARTCLSKPFALREFHSAIAGIINAG
jgi:two-component system NtrC family sensor kinase